MVSASTASISAGRSMDVEGEGEGSGSSSSGGGGCLLKLRALHLGGVTNLTERGIISFMHSFPQFPALVDLNLSGTHVSDATLHTIGARNSSLRHLSLAYSDVSEAALRALLERIGRKLELLNISWVATTTGCKNIPLTVDFFIDFLPTRCIALQDLDVTGLRHVSVPCLSQ